MTAYLNVSRHAVTLASGTPLAPGEVGEPDFTTEHDRALKDDGSLLRASEPDTPTAKPAGKEKP